MRNRRCLVILAGLALAVSLNAQETAASRVVKVTVYGDRALVTRRAEVSLFKGESTVLFGDLPSAVDPASVQVSGKGAFTLRDVRVATRQRTRDVSAQLTALENEKRGLEDKLALVNDRIREAEAERTFLADMAKRLTTNAGNSESLPLDPASWARMLDFHRQRNAALNETVRTSRREVQALQAEIDRVNREIRNLGSGTRLSVTEAELVLDASAPTKAVLELSYIVAGPSWRPDYVLRADSESARLSVHYRALVRQNTGEGWEGAELSLSTARPQAGGSMPVLPPWYLDIYSPPSARRDEAAKSAPAPAAAGVRGAAAESSAALAWDEPAPEMRIDTALASTGATAVTFSIPGATTVASDNKDRTVTIAVLDLPVTFSYAAVPKLSPYAYFRCEVKNDSAYPILAGPSHVYVDGSYMADAALEAVPAGGSFKADLGIDEGIRVERKLLRKFDENTGALTKKSKTTWEYEIRVKNSKRRDIVLEVSDQLPVSLNEQIVVKALAPAYSKDTDVFRKIENETFVWTLKLAAGKESVLPLSFSVEYPRGMPILGLE
ncbi:MAG: mucoidy inhibitor MuiA family protein [Treponema sp.]|nr:mucoidy inhibitor MuiA family protein [Treponema sp.]